MLGTPIGLAPRCSSSCGDEAYALALVPEPLIARRILKVRMAPILALFLSGWEGRSIIILTGVTYAI